MSSKIYNSQEADVILFIEILTEQFYIIHLKWHHAAKHYLK